MSTLLERIRARAAAQPEPTPAPKAPKPKGQVAFQIPPRDTAEWDVWSFDTETHPFFQGCMDPPMVCGSWASVVPGSETIARQADTIAWVRAALENPKVHLVGANLAYDLGVIIAWDKSLKPLVYRALRDSRLHDVAIREALIDIALGNLFLDSNGRPLNEDDDGLRYSLATLVMRYFKLDISEDKKDGSHRMKYKEYDPLPLEEWPEGAREYPKRDARHTVNVFWAQEEKARTVIANGNLHDEPYQVRAAWALWKMSLRGVRSNREKVLTWEAAILKELGELQALRVKHDFVRLDDAEPEDLEKGNVVAYRPKLVRVKKAEVEKGAVYDRMKTYDSGQVSYWREDHDSMVPLKYVRNTPVIQQAVVKAYEEMGYDAPRTKEGVAIDRDTLVQSKDPVLMSMGRGNRVEKYKSTYLPKLKAAMGDMPYNPRFNVLVATGRCSGDFQQLPQKGGIRELYTPTEGFCYGQADYEGLELRTMSQRAINVLGYSMMAEALKKMLDPHCIASSKFMKCSYEEARALYKKNDKRGKGFRDLGKVLNFGKGGGLGPAGLVYNARNKDEISFCLLAGAADVCGLRKQETKVQGKMKMVCSVCVEVCAALSVDWFEVWPEQKEMAQRASRLTRKDHEFPQGRRVTMEVWSSGRVRSNCGYTQWLNGPFQGAGGDLAKRAAWLIDWECNMVEDSPLYGCHPILQIHDEAIIEIPVNGWEAEAAERMSALMLAPSKEILPDLWETMAAEPTLSTVISKDVKSVRDANDRLVIWHPGMKTLPDERGILRVA